MAFKGKKKTPEEKMKEIEELTAGMDQQIDSYFVSETAMREHLAFMANFYNYSQRNMTLIDKQFMGAEAVGSFNFWKNKGAAVQKGEKGIKILVPTPVQFYKKNGIDVPVSSASKQDRELIDRKQLETTKKTFFKIGHVFEYTQTNARELNLSVSEIFGKYHRDGSLESSREMMAALNKMATKLDFIIVDESPFELGTAKGAAAPSEKIIALNPRNTEFENVSVLIHELAHAKMHTPERAKELSTSEKEFQAEMVAYVVANRYDIDTEDFTLSYLANWTNGAALKDKEQLLNEVRSTSSEFIDEIDSHFDQVKEKEQLQEKEQSVPSDLEIEAHALNRGKELNASEPVMYIYGISTELRPFGEMNNLDFDQYKQEQIAYFVAIPSEGKETLLISSQYEKGEYIHPLHQLEKEQLVDKESVATLETNYHDELLKQDDAYIQSFAARLKTEIHKEEATATDKNKKLSKINTIEIER
ncbi:ArdC-like ssDNA-binding domain-containing protein [Planococcus sp. S3-L1]|uniref:ArdC-like ssDNA-binding domain-containing protein n=1 Tax=Planococcus sp. S3-L1 TaxID=3046200 RepID=UPI0024B9D839|nr:ArdC-like ssDNA-binding domain-containing protein [Planococcus sp. S3-L1]MDJ0332674.1 ArdC-like ssDNA-binding domain-containing protein [Planococcus sp. S3-L1]